jgi:hypothetical protein
MIRGALQGLSGAIARTKLSKQPIRGYDDGGSAALKLRGKGGSGADRAARLLERWNQPNASMRTNTRACLRESTRPYRCHVADLTSIDTIACGPGVFCARHAPIETVTRRAVTPSRSKTSSALKGTVLGFSRAAERTSPPIALTTAPRLSTRVLRLSLCGLCAFARVMPFLPSR